MDKSLAEIKEIVDKGMSAFEEYKKANDERLAEISKTGSATPETEAKLEKIDDFLGKFDDLNQEIVNQAKAKEEAEAQSKEYAEKLAEQKGRIDALETAAKRPGSSLKDEGSEDPEYVKAFDHWMRKGVDLISTDERSALEERKALVMANDAAAGYYAAPSDMDTEIIKEIVEISPFRGVARATAIGSRSLLLPRRTGVFAATRVAEIGSRSETTGYTAGQVEIVAPEMFAEVRLSQQLLEDAFVNLEDEIRMDMAEQFAVKEGAEFIAGNGADEAEGILTATGTTEVASGAAAAIAHASSAEADGLIDCFHAIKTGYAVNGTWVLNRLSLRDVRKLKDTNEQYVWQPGLADLRPNTILGAPYVEMPDMPDIAANAYPIAFGDFRRAYRIVDRVGMSLLRDPYTLANVGQIKMLARKRVGGAVVLAEAIAKIKIATSV
jgi:HK97 family phage major capsid protein